MRHVKILHIMASCSKSSGVAQTMMNYYRVINNSVTFDFLLFWDVGGSFKEEIESYGGHIYICGQPRLASMLKYIQFLEALFATHSDEYDAIHLHELYLNPFIIPIAKRHGIKIVIAHSHTTKLSERKSGQIRNRVLYTSLPFLADQFFACSYEAGVAAFGKRISNSKKFHLIRNSINAKAYTYSDTERSRIRSELGIGDCFVVGHIGRYSPQKNHAFLLKVFRCIQQKDKDSKLLLVGEGPGFCDILHQATELGLESKVIQTGARSDIGNLLSAMDVFVFPSLFEGLGMVLVEAQCNGLACYTSSVVPDEARILNSYTSIDLDEGPQKWADIILGQKEVRDQNALQAIRDHGYDICVEGYALLELYHRIIEVNNESTEK